MTDGCRVPLARYPGFNRFVLDWLEGRGEARKFLPVGQTILSVPPRQTGLSVLQAIIESNKQWGLFVREPVEAWARGEAVTLVAGQQVGFAGGPLYTLAKIATLVKMKRELEAAGKKATAFFWLATEDHDFHEVATLTVPVPNRPLDLLTLRVTRAGRSSHMVGGLEVPETLIAELLALYDLPRPQWLREGITFRDSFAELIASIFGDEIVLVDALLPELRRAGAPLFEAINARWSELQRTLAERSREVGGAGYDPQVETREGTYTLLFQVNDDGTRTALDAPTQLPPEKTSTSALTRPLLQDFVLAPDVFVGGPAEIAYYAQIAPLHAMLGIAMPRIALRGHALVAPKRVVKALEKYAIDPAEVFASADALLAAREPESVARIEDVAAEARKDLIARIEQIGELALPADHAVARALSRSIGHIEYHFDKLTERAIRGLVRKNRERYAAVKELVATLHPDAHVQDRVVGWLAYWLKYDRLLVDRLIEEIEPDSTHFRIVSL